MENIRLTINISDNPNESFRHIIRDLEEIAKENNTLVTEEIDSLIKGLKTSKRGEYKMNGITTILICGKNEHIINDCILYLRKRKRLYEEKEKKEKSSEKKQKLEAIWNDIKVEIYGISDKINKTRTLEVKDSEQLIKETETIRKIKVAINEGNNIYGLDDKGKKYLTRKLDNELLALQKVREEQEKAKVAMEGIKEILDREEANGNVESRVGYLKSIKWKVANRKNGLSNEAKKYLLEMIDISISDEQDHIYYEQVKHFTNNFQFLGEYPELINARLGARLRKFTDKKAYVRFCNLRTKLQDGFSEYSQVNRLLEDERVNDADKRILQARKIVMDEEIEKRRREIEGR